MGGAYNAGTSGSMTSTPYSEQSSSTVLFISSEKDAETAQSKWMSHVRDFYAQCQKNGAMYQPSLYARLDTREFEKQMIFDGPEHVNEDQFTKDMKSNAIQHVEIIQHANQEGYVFYQPRGFPL